MKSLITVASIILLLTTLSFSQSGTIVYDSFYSPSLSTTIPLAIYLPPNYSPTADPYRTYIFLHGAGGSTYTTHLGTISSTLNALINDPNLDFQPIVTICPGITWSGLGGGVNWQNLHNYSDSYLTGNYESVISEDLVNWIDTCSYNLSGFREERAIGGFSMGGICVQIAIKHCEKFIAFTSHCGYTSVNGLADDKPYILAESNPPSPYHFHPINGIYSLRYFSLAAAWSPDTLNPNQPTWQVDFPIDSISGELIPEIFDSLWVKYHEPTVLLQNPLVYTDSIHMYFDTRIGDGNRENNRRLHMDLDSLGIDHGFHIFPTGAHQYSSDAATKGFMFLDSVMDRSVVTRIQHSQSVALKNFDLKQNYPNPFNPQTRIEFELVQHNHVILEVYNLLGQKIETLISKKLLPGTHNYQWDATSYPSGVYLYRLTAGEFVETRKMILLK